MAGVTPVTLQPFTPVDPDKEVGDPNPPGDMNNTALQLLALGSSYNVMNAIYGGGADPSGETYSDTAFSDATTAASEAGAPLLIPPGTYTFQDPINWKLPYLNVVAAGADNTYLKQTTANTPVIEVAGQNQNIGGFSLVYPSQQSSGNTDAIGMALGDNSVGSCFVSQYHDIDIALANQAMAIVSTSVGGAFSCIFSNININGYSYSAMNMQAASGSGSANSTGCLFNNIYIHNNYFGTATTCSERAVWFSGWDEAIFNQLNIEHGDHYDADVLFFQQVGNMVINSLHYESLIVSGNPGYGFLAVNDGGSVIVNGMTIRSCTIDGTDQNPVVRFNTAAANVVINSFNNPSSGMTVSTSFPWADFGSTEDCTLQVNGVVASAVTGASVNSTTGDVLVVNPSPTGSAYLCAPNVYAPGSQTLKATPAPTTVASGSNGGEISAIASWSSPSAGVLDVASGGVTNWPTAGTINVAASGSTTAVVTYTGISGNSLTGCAYVSGSATGTVATGGAVDLVSLAPFDSGVICTNEFIAPASGNVLVTLDALMQQSLGGDEVMLALAATGTLTPVIGSSKTFQLASTTTLDPVMARFYVSGLTFGTSYQFDLMGVSMAGQTVTIYAQGLTAVTLGNRGGPVTMTVEAV
jgi:hypothetical protein